MNRKSLLWHIFVPFVAVSVLSLVLITTYMSQSLREFFYDQTAADLEDRAQLLLSEVEAELAADRFDAVQAFSRKMGAAAGQRVTVILPDGVVVADSEEDPARMDNHALRPEIAEAFAGNVGRSVRFSATLGHQRMYVAVPVTADDRRLGVLRTSVSLASIDRALAVVRQRIAAGGLLLALGAALISYLLARRISVPLREMKAVAEQLARGQLGTRLTTVPDSEEIGALAQALNTMAEQLDDRIGTIEQQRNEQEAVLSSMVESVVAIDRDEVVIGINEAGCTLLGVDTAAAVGHLLPEVVRNTDLIAMARTALTGGDPVEGEIVLHRDGERHLQVHATGLHDQAGWRLGALLVLNDVTRTRRLESVRRDFVANVSHELRTPITSIKGFVETLQTNPPDDPRARARFLDIINRQADRLQAIIDDLLALSRLEQDSDPATLGPEDTPVAEIIAGAVTVCTARSDAAAPAVTVDCPADLQVPANPALLEQAVINLLDNALKHGGADTPVQITARRHDQRVLITVRDAGRGIDAEHLPRIFERFYRVDRARSRNLGGTGLGLAIVKHIARAHGGEVSVASVVGKGATFTIALPAAASPAQGDTSCTPTSHPPSAG